MGEPRSCTLKKAVNCLAMRPTLATCGCLRLQILRQCRQQAAHAQSYDGAANKAHRSSEHQFFKALPSALSKHRVPSSSLSQKILKPILGVRKLLLIRWKKWKLVGVCAPRDSNGFRYPGKERIAARLANNWRPEGNV